jgi:hypothetical protein
VKSLNWTTKNLTETRDYAIVTDHEREVHEIVDCFDADWNRQSFTAGSDARLVRAARRGVNVHVMVRSPHSVKLDKLVEAVGGLRILDDVRVKVHKLKHLGLHGKMFLADGIASMVAIESRDSDVVDRLHAIAHHDWQNSHPIDLTDEGLLSEIGDESEAAELLVLDDTYKH